MYVGDILLFKPDSFITNFISKASRGKYSHVAMAIDKDIIIEASWQGNITRKFETKEYKKVVIFRNKHINNLQRYDMLSYVQNLKGKKYDWKLLFSIMFEKYLGIKSLDDSNKWICSELIYNIYQKVGIDISKSKLSDNITPVELYNFLINNDDFEIVEG